MILITLWVDYFFRDPERFSINDDSYIVRPADGLIELICSYFNLSWEESDELKFLAKHSDINTKMNSEKLSLYATMLTNVLKNNIKWLEDEQLKQLITTIQEMSKQNQDK